jgi:hypothetical protein
VEDIKNKYRTVFETPLGTVYGSVVELNDLEYTDTLNFLKNSYSFNFMRFDSPRGDIIIPGDMIKKSFILLEKID